MKKYFADFVRETTTTTGTGNITLTAATGYVRFNDRFTAADRLYYEIRDGNNWEKGYGTYNGANVLARTTILGTLVAGVWTTGGAALNLSGAARVWATPPEDYLKNLVKVEPSILAASTVQNILPGFSYVLTGDNCDLTLPSSPDGGDRIEIMSAGATNGTIRANGQKIGSVVGDMTIDIFPFAFTMIYTDATFGWKVYG